MNSLKTVPRVVYLIIVLIMFYTGFALLACNNSNTDESADTKRDTATTGNSPASPDTMHHTDTANTAPATHAEADISGTYADTVVNGKAIFDVENGKVKMKLDITVPAKAGKSVAVHFHEHGDCSDKGNMAHGHWNPTSAQHGKWGTGSYHLGDIGNIKLDKDGKGSITVATDLWTLGGTATSNLIGKSIIVHGGTDDYKTQPTGNAGSRIGCGVIR